MGGSGVGDHNHSVHSTWEDCLHLTPTESAAADSQIAVPPMRYHISKRTRCWRFASQSFLRNFLQDTSILGQFLEMVACLEFVTSLPNLFIQLWILPKLFEKCCTEVFYIRFLTLNYSYWSSHSKFLKNHINYVLYVCGNCVLWTLKKMMQFYLLIKIRQWLYITHIKC